MEKNKKRGKAVALSLAMAAALSLPPGASAQGLFGGDAGGGGYPLLGRGGGTGVESPSFGHQSFGANQEGGFLHQAFGADQEGTFGHQAFGANQEGGFTHQSFTSPTGSGLLVLLAAGMGYAAAKKRKGGKGRRNKSK